jgi:hypothetical protein
VDYVGVCVCETYGPSVQVKTCPKPHDRTSFSAEARDLVMISCLEIVWLLVARWFDSRFL